MSELSKVMIYRSSPRVLEAACWSCRASDTYCDGLWMQEYRDCCEDCRDADHDAHTGRAHHELGPRGPAKPTLKPAPNRHPRPIQPPWATL